LDRFSLVFSLELSFLIFGSFSFKKILEFKKNVLDYFFCKNFVGSPVLTVLLLPLKFFEFSKPNILFVLRRAG